MAPRVPLDSDLADEQVFHLRGHGKMNGTCVRRDLLEVHPPPGGLIIFNWTEVVTVNVAKSNSLSKCHYPIVSIKSDRVKMQLDTCGRARGGGKKACQRSCRSWW